MRGVSDEARRIWTAPVLIAALTLASLVGALVAEGFWDGLAAFVLFAVLAYATACGLRQADRRQRR